MIFFQELLQLSLGTRTSFSHVLSNEEWNELYAEANKQAIVGILLGGVERLSRDQRPSQNLLLQWIGVAQMIGQQNQKLNNAAKLLNHIFLDGGLRTCVLKGQGIARLYPNPDRRQSGDIDLWVEGSRKESLTFLKNSFFHTGKVVIHHVDCSIVEGVETEVHFIPVWAYNPFVNWRLQRFFRRYASAQFSNFDNQLGFAYPTPEFNAVYCLAHIYMHFLYEGIGMRQIIDYFYVLKNLNDNERSVAISNINRIGLRRIASAVMYVLSVACEIEQDELLYRPDEKRGEVLYKEIIKGGNFGHSDDRVAHFAEEGRWKSNFKRLKRDVTLFRYFPIDILAIPFWKIWHWCWRKWNGYL